MSTYFFLFAPKFQDLPLELATRLHGNDPSRAFAGLVTGRRRVYARISAHDVPRIRPVDFLDDLEREWLQTGGENERLQQHADVLGEEWIRRILISDRHVGAGYITGAEPDPSPLSRLMRERNVVMPRRYIAGLLDYLTHMVANVAPNIVFAYAVAGAPATGLAAVCDHYGVPFRALASARVGSRFILDSSPYSSLEPVQERLGNYQEITDVSLREAKGYLQAFRSTHQQPEGSEFVRRRLNTRQSWRWWKSLPRRVAQRVRDYDGPILRRSSGRAFVREVATRQRAKRLLGTDFFTPVEELPAGPYVYYPLHVDPEASTMVRSPMFTNQLFLAEQLSKSLPVGMLLVVKEHLPMVGRRPPGYYESIASLPNTQLVDPRAASGELIQDAKAVATSTGTAGFEGLMLGTPVLVFGRPPYLAIQSGIIHASDMEGLPTALDHAFELPPCDEGELVRYLACLFDTSFELPAELLLGDVTSETLVRHTDAVEAVVTEIERAAG